ncbi:DUF5647 family protein [Thermus altitudinis]|uniref:DUF5647 family protein n=1 Tax=Thermus altitudinis TaxID=2908145 RepID=UPI001FAA7887|nr:DUF5647 family protein [Thermus altitudinis]
MGAGSLNPEDRLFPLQGRFGEALLERPELLEALPERFVLVVLRLDDPEAARLALERLPHLQAWTQEEGPLVYALFQGQELVGVVHQGAPTPGVPPPSPAGGHRGPGARGLRPSAQGGEDGGGQPEG